MTNPKGTYFETAVVEYLTECGALNIERRAKSGSRDRGDIAGVIGTVVEVKNRKAMDLAGWLNEAEEERKNADATLGLVIHKRKGKGKAQMAEQYATMSLATLVTLLSEAGRFVWTPEKGQVIAW